MSNIACLDHPQGSEIVSELPQTGRRESVGENWGSSLARALPNTNVVFCQAVLAADMPAGKKLSGIGEQKTIRGIMVHLSFLAAALQERLGCSQQASHLYITRWDIGLFWLQTRYFRANNMPEAVHVEKSGNVLCKFMSRVTKTPAKVMYFVGIVTTWTASSVNFELRED